MRGLEPVPLRELLTLESYQSWQVDCLISGFVSLAPVSGWIETKHHGNILEVYSIVNTIVNLCYDRCLGQFNQGLGLCTGELIRLSKTYPYEETPDNKSSITTIDDLVECLDLYETFDPAQWLFEQLSLELPTMTYYGADCPEPPVICTDETDRDEGDLADPRWHILRKLKL